MAENHNRMGTTLGFVGTSEWKIIVSNETISVRMEFLKTLSKRLMMLSTGYLFLAWINFLHQKSYTDYLISFELLSVCAHDTIVHVVDTLRVADT